MTSNAVGKFYNEAFEYLKGLKSFPKATVNAINQAFNKMWQDKAVTRFQQFKKSKDHRIMKELCSKEGNNSQMHSYLIKNEAEKFRMEIINKYKKYISDEKLELLENKLAILEDELNLRMQYLLAANEEITKEGKSR